ncbi:hypothetical protein ZIOFF_016586 [Zingiber officinale]|uniref:Uncharacterized protein n=1 Tax=Zingiber officinale TaxID=94328 RepID=A0A8J5HWA4_ZINOF|nr:hypothetical protein ZIOFF_016586 [Zingiber officinale]
MQFIHLGVIQVRLQILHRREEGTLAMVVFRDNRWQGDQAILATMEIDLTSGTNLLVTRGLVGRLSNTPNVGFAYEVQNVVDYLTSHGVQALPGRSYNTKDVLGQNWVIKQSTIHIPMQSMEIIIEHISTPDVFEVEDLDDTERGHHEQALEEIQALEEQLRDLEIARAESLTMNFIPSEASSSTSSLDYNDA